MSICPLSMISGNAINCDGACEYCPPQSLNKIASYSEYFQCLNFPNDLFGNGMARDGLDSVSGALDRLADAIENGDDRS